MVGVFVRSTGEERGGDVRGSEAHEPKEKSPTKTAELRLSHDEVGAMWRGLPRSLSVSTFICHYLWLGQQSTSGSRPRDPAW